MIQQNKPSGYFSTSDPLTGKKIEGETRICAHCSFTWIYRPGSGIKRGWCTRCNGLLCGQDKCMKFCINSEQRLRGYETQKSWGKLINSFRGADILGRTEVKEE